MIKEEDLLEYQKRAEAYLKDFDNLKLNHFAIATRDADEYKKVSRESGIPLHEVTFHGRRIGTVQFGNYILEVLEPKPEQENLFFRIDHIGYVKSDFVGWIKTYEGDILSRFDVGGTHGIKISPEDGLVIEVRNNHILDSIDDFNSLNK